MSAHVNPAEAGTGRAWRPGDVLNERYTVVDAVGEGGMGVVCRVQDALHPGRDLALKTLSPAVVDASRAQLLRDEFRTMAELSHPNIARVYDFERIAGTDEHCFTMEYLEGRDLLAAARGEALEPILGWIVEACRALQYLHGRGVIHADFKPHNVVVTRSRHAKVLDFGLSGASDAGLFLGTPAYMAPELGTGVAADARVDLYALGITMFHVLYGHLPFSGRNVLEILALHASAPLPFPDDCRVSEAVRGVMERLCAKNPEDRFASADEVIAALAAASGRAYPPETTETHRGYVSSARLVGRDAEELALRSFCLARTAAAGPGADEAALACVSGPSGVGKSRLVAEVRRSLQLAGVPVVEANCYEGAVDELGPLRDSIEAVVRLGRAHGMAGLEDRYRTTLDWLVTGARPPARSIAEEETLRMKALRDLADLVLDLSGSVGLVLSVGDLHWARTSTTDFLKVLCERQTARWDAGRAARLGVVVTHRDDEASGPLEDLLAAVGPERRLGIALAPLSPAQTAELIASMLGASDVPQPFNDRVAAETGGNPFFIEEVMRALMERGDVTMEAGRWAARTEVVRIELPRTVAAVLERRLASVDARARDVLEWLAVYAQPMPQSLLTEASGLGTDDLTETLGTLGDRRMVVAAGAGRFRPAHDELREFLYARMDRSARRARHAAVARVLERAGGEAEYVIERAHHYWHAEDDERARVWAERAARLAEQTFAIDVAIDNCERLRRLAARRGDEAARRSAVDRLLELCAIPGQYARVVAVAEDELARRTDPPQRARILALQGEALGAQGKLGAALEKLREAAALLGARIPRSTRARRLYIAVHYVRVVAALALRRGDPARARRFSPGERRRRELLAGCFWLMGVYSTLHGDDEGYGLVFPGIHTALPLGRSDVMSRLLVNGAFASHIMGRYGASERLVRMAQSAAASEQERAVVLTVSLLARQLAQRPIFAEQRPVQALEADIVRAIEVLSTRSKALHANVARMVATTTVTKYAARHQHRPEVARWAEAMRGTVHFGYVQGAVAAMAQIEGDRRRADRAYALACAGCASDVHQAWIAGDFGYVCAVTNDVEKAVGCVETARRLLPAMEMKSDATLWAAAMTVATGIVLEARGASPPWLWAFLGEVVTRMDRLRHLPPDVRLHREAGRVALGRSSRSALEDARRIARASWTVEQSKSGHPDGWLVATLALRRSSQPEDARMASAWAEELVALVEARFPPGYVDHVRELMGGEPAP